MPSASFLDSITPLAARQRVAEIVPTLSPALRTAWYIALPEKAAEWIHALGPGCDGRLRALLPPVPPSRLRSLTAAPEEEVFLWSGLSDISYLLGLYEAHACSERPAIPTVLDFGCGCGRLARFLDRSTDYRTIACDVNADMAAWCAAHLKNLTVLKSGPLPPIAIPDGSVDFAYALSVFTHLPREAAGCWLDELARVLAPQGLLAMTAHGYPALEIIRGSKVHQAMFGLDVGKSEAIIHRLAVEGHVFLPYAKRVVRRAQAGETYGNAFIDPTRGGALWADQFELVVHIPGGLRGWQDVFLLRVR